MLSFLRKVAICVVAVVAVGCVSSGTSTFRYQEPTTGPRIPNERIVEAPFPQTWDLFVRRLATSFFVINNVEKESRILNVSFSSDTPSRYIECGRSNRTVSWGDQELEFNYEVAESSMYRIANGVWMASEFVGLPMIARIDRKTSLDGRINIYIAPEGDERTIVTVNARYHFKVSTSGVNEAMSAEMVASSSALPTPPLRECPLIPTQEVETRMSRAARSAVRQAHSKPSYSASWTSCGESSITLGWERWLARKADSEKAL